jgi:hypothetical protein
MFTRMSSHPKCFHRARGALHPCSFAAALLLVSGCASLETASLDVHRQAARPDILELLPPTHQMEAWQESETTRLREDFQTHIYGFLPDQSQTRILSRAVVDANAFNGAGSFETIEIKVSAIFADHAVDTDVFVIDLVLPNDAAAPVGVVIMQTFCPRTDAVPHPAVTAGGPGVSCNGGPVSWLMRRLFGRVVARPPMEDFLARGFAIASVHSRDVVPDHPRAGLDALNTLAPERAESDARWGAIAAWGWMYSRVVDVLADDPRIDADRLIAFGHSRFGKAALFAAAFDERIDGVISNQSGTGGAALSRDKAGETLAQIVRSYPHWFANALDNYASREHELPVDQHQMLALIAPRPIFLGNARRDIWSDPNGTFRAAIGADPIYELYGVRGLDQANMTDFNPNADIAYWLRPGFHSVEPEDWAAMLAFLTAHFGDSLAAQ